MRSLALFLLACLAVGFVSPASAAGLDALSTRASSDLVEGVDPGLDPVDLEYGEPPSPWGIERLTLTPDLVPFDPVPRPVFRLGSAVPIRAPPAA